MLPWGRRPQEVANLFNPAFTALLLHDSIGGFQTHDPKGLPYSFVFFVLPVVLHKQTREALPRTLRTKMHVWIQKFPELRIDFAERTRNLLPYTKEALAFGIQKKLIKVTEEGKLLACQKGSLSMAWPNEEEPAVCRIKANFFGRWLARAGDISTIFAMWGIRP